MRPGKKKDYFIYIKLSIYEKDKINKNVQYCSDLAYIQNKSF